MTKGEQVNSIEETGQAIQEYTKFEKVLFTLPWLSLFILYVKEARYWKEFITTGQFPPFRPTNKVESFLYISSFVIILITLLPMFTFHERSDWERKFAYGFIIYMLLEITVISIRDLS